MKLKTVILTGFFLAISGVLSIYNSPVAALGQFNPNSLAQTGAGCATDNSVATLLNPKFKPSSVWLRFNQIDEALHENSYLFVELRAYDRRNRLIDTHTSQVRMMTRRQPVLIPAEWLRSTTHIIEVSYVPSLRSESTCLSSTLVMETYI